MSRHTTSGEVRIERHCGPRDGLRALFELAEDSAAQLDSYLPSGRVLVARIGDEIVGHLQLVETGSPGESEIKNMAVRESHQGRGIGRLLVLGALRTVRDESVRRLLVATAAADVGNLRFYQRMGFRLHAVERDAFTAATGYPEVVLIDGIRLRDRVWLDQDLDDPDARTGRDPEGD